jgi:hypothetical protein
VTAEDRDTLVVVDPSRCDAGERASTLPGTVERWHQTVSTTDVSVAANDGDCESEDAASVTPTPGRDVGWTA